MALLLLGQAKTVQLDNLFLSNLFVCRTFIWQLNTLFLKGFD
jgi:hypothetical protein